MDQKLTLETIAAFCLAKGYDPSEVEVVVENGSMFVKCHPNVFSLAQVKVFADHVVIPLSLLKVGHLSTLIDFMNDQGVPTTVSFSPRGVRVPAAYQKSADQAIEDFRVRGPGG